MAADRNLERAIESVDNQEEDAGDTQAERRERQAKRFAELLQRRARFEGARGESDTSRTR